MDEHTKKLAHEAHNAITALAKCTTIPDPAMLKQERDSIMLGACLPPGSSSSSSSMVQAIRDQISTLAAAARVIKSGPWTVGELAECIRGTVNSLERDVDRILGRIATAAGVESPEPWTTDTLEQAIMRKMIGLVEERHDARESREKLAHLLSIPVNSSFEQIEKAVEYFIRKGMDKTEQERPPSRHAIFGGRHRIVLTADRRGFTYDDLHQRHSFTAHLDSTCTHGWKPCPGPFALLRSCALVYDDAKAPLLIARIDVQSDGTLTLADPTAGL